LFQIVSEPNRGIGVALREEFHGVFEIADCVFCELIRRGHLRLFADGTAYTLHGGRTVDQAAGGDIVETTFDLGANVGLPALFFLKVTEAGSDELRRRSVATRGYGVFDELFEFRGEGDVHGDPPCEG
jgi:hypothetical protein